MNATRTDSVLAFILLLLCATVLVVFLGLIADSVSWTTGA